MKAETFPAGRRQAPAAILINQKLIYNLKGGRGKHMLRSACKGR